MAGLAKVDSPLAINNGTGTADGGKEHQVTKDERDPLVSVIMAVHNGAATVGEAIDSVSAQRFTRWELVMCDDGSTDATGAVLKAAQERFGEDRVKLLKNPKRMRLSHSLNCCLEVANGDYIARLDADDQMEPSRLALQVEFLEQNQQTDLVGTAMQRFDETGDTDIVMPRDLNPDANSLKRRGVPFFHATVMARREVFTTLGGYTVSWRTRRAQDIDLWYRFFAAGFTGSNLPTPLYRARNDDQAVRRRTRAALVGATMTRLKGNRLLGYPMSETIRLLPQLSRVLIPTWVMNERRKWIRRRARHEQKARTSLGGPQRQPQKKDRC